MYLRTNKSATAAALTGPGPEPELTTGSADALIFNSIKINLQADTSLIRDETYMGVDYKAIPVVALVQSVIQGANSSAPELAKADVFAKYPDAWNGVPVVMNHPEQDKSFVPASSPDVLEQYQMGFVFNARRDGPKLKVEAWINPERIKALGKLAQETFDALMSGQVVEVSTGMFVDVLEAKGVYKNRVYEQVWTNVVPDHLAILDLSKTGACSVADGCGAPRLNQQAGETQCTCQSTQAPVTEAPATPSEPPLMQVGRLSCNKVADSLLSVNVMKALNVALDIQAENTDLLYPYVIAFNDQFVVYESLNQKIQDFQVFRQDFIIDSNLAVTFTSSPELVMVTLDVVPIQPANDSTTTPSVNQKGFVMSDDTAKKEDPKTEVKVEGTKKAEEAKADVQAYKSATSTPESSTPTEVKDLSAQIEQAVQAKTSIKSVEQLGMTVEEYIQQAPVSFRDVLRSSLAMHEQTKEKAIKTLQSSKRCSFTAEELHSKTLRELQQLVELSGLDQANFEGLATPQVQEDNESIPVAPKVFE